jgi:hypothetical protein
MYVKERAAAELLNSEPMQSRSKNSAALENTRFFHRFSNIRCRIGLQELPGIYYTDKHQNFNEDEETLSLDVLKSNIQQVLITSIRRKFIEHLLGSMGDTVIFRRDSS